MRTDQVYLDDVIDSINIIFEYIADKTSSDFEENLMVQDAVFRRFEILGEAASNISNETKIQNPEVEWRLMTVMRNKLIHEYFGVSSFTVYQTIKNDLPILLEQILAIREKF